jgi:hypothetical protein
LLNLGLSEKLPEYLRFDIHDFLGISLFH